MDFEKDIVIDKFNLTEELVEQPQKYYDWGKALSISETETLIAKDKLEIIRSEIELKIRNHPTLYDLPNNPKEAQIKAAVNINRKVRRANKNYLDALRIEKTLKKAERAFEHRKKSLEGLVYLSNQFYFADPKTNSHTQEKINRKRLLDSAREKRKGVLRRRRK
jgi:hypothetical protein